LSCNLTGFELQTIGDVYDFIAGYKICDGDWCKIIGM